MRTPIATPRLMAGDTPQTGATTTRLVRRHRGHRVRRAPLKFARRASRGDASKPSRCLKEKETQRRWRPRSARLSLRSSTRRKRPRSWRRSRVRRFRLIPRTSRQPRVVQEVRVGVAPPTRESRIDAGFRPSEWRDPDSNRGHHDFQAGGPARREARNPWKPSGSRVICPRPSKFAICGLFQPVN